MTKYKYLAPPTGYLISEPIRSDQVNRLRSLALEMIDPDSPQLDDFNRAMAKATLQELQQFFIQNGYSFQSKSVLKKTGLWKPMHAEDGVG